MAIRYKILFEERKEAKQIADALRVKTENARILEAAKDAVFGGISFADFNASQKYFD